MNPEKIRCQLYTGIPVNKILFSIVLILLIFGGCKKKKRQSSVELFPSASTEIWGYQNLNVLVGLESKPVIKNISYNAGGSEVPIITKDNPLRYEPGAYEVTLCAECIEASEITVTVEFAEESSLPPLKQRYTINHLPVPKINGELSGDIIKIDAGSSRDPEGKELKFTWQTRDTIFTGAQLSINKDLLLKEPILAGISDGVTVLYDILTYDVESGTPLFAAENLECTGLQVITTGSSLLNPEIRLGPTIAPGTQLSVTDGKLNRSYSVSFAYEVRSPIKPAATIFDEGQDAAGTSNINADDDTKKEDRKGKKRKETNRSEYEDGEIPAPFPDPLPPAGNHPPMTEDSYDHHPDWARAFKNGANGAEMFRVKGKGLQQVAGVNLMVWYDQPGFAAMATGTDISHGMYFRAYFRSWMKDKIPPCEKFYILEIEIDKTGKVTKNEITMR